MKHREAPLAQLLERQYRRVRQTRLIWSAGLVFTATAIVAATRLGWWKHHPAWAAVPAVLSAGFLVWWLHRASGLTRTQFARELDARWELRARLESAEELSTHDSPLARAQRADARHRVDGREPVGAAGWLTGLAVATLALGLLGVEGSVLALKAMNEKKPPAASAAKNVAAAPTPEASATIDWKTPDREIKATAIEEVPLTAVADSPKGFTRLSLEVFVNGKHQLTRPLDANAAGKSGGPGVHEVTPSLYMDETGAKPFDIVSYHLAGELNGGTPGRVVTSPLQFIQVRPPQAEVIKLAKANPDAMRLMAMLSALKLGQLQLIEANFALTQIEDARGGAAWQSENTRAAADQDELSKKADDTRAFAAKRRSPALIENNLEQARGAMRQAVQAMKAERNQDATEPQGRALTLITECEKLFNEALEVAGDIPPVSMLDPFKDDQVFKLEPRTQTPAGKIETLVTRQGSLIPRFGVRTNASGSGSDGLAEAQNEIAQEAAALAGSGELDQAVEDTIKEGAAAAAAAGRQIGAGDFTAAREPAADALAKLQRAVDAQDRVGRSVAVAELVRARLALNTASRAGSAERATTISAVRGDLRAAAIQQQRTGSAEAAQQLAALAESLSAAKLPGSSSAPGSPQRAHELAIRAARTQVALGARESATKRAVRLLNRVTRAGEDAHAAGALADVELASQETEWLTNQPALNQDARKLGDLAGELQGASDIKEADWQSLTTAAGRIAAALEGVLVAGARDERVKQFNPDDIDPAYREAVEAYFERLSREDAGSLPAGANP